ncbi:MAG: tRNA pseudouridine(38-40) synthase TruA, partial [Alphaproteobacteria bacterium]|nr:tRNA pseudouridine(38-40) synthase TruA [Alphaproteobacteria bacterium]
GRSPLLADRTWHCRSTLDVEAMDAAARLLVGTHDVASFRSVGCSASTTTRTLADARVQRVDELVHLEIEGHGFLRHMVRILAGTLREVGLGSRSVDDFATTLAARDRRTAGRTAPPHGLTLLWVRHADGPVAWREDEGEDG